ncbi:hypothetical protein RND71_024623 [Anisodus tanguticus]|uniref:Uncharacterized protein n=1 Tax=Anisodus tanguticus TaxID=243964 RepID=A0AAE1RRJ5_9SOLA|nr:hypothetical protein RND71_024623 [Anisodus tanguticus]
MGSAFLIGRKSTKKITKKVENEKIEDESCKGLHFLLPDSSSPCIEQQQPSSNGADKLCDNDSTSLLSTPSLIQSEHSKEEENSPSCDKLPVHKEELVLSETKISLLPDPDHGLNEVSEARIEVIQGNKKTEVLARVHQDQATIFSTPDLQVDSKREFLVDEKHNDKEELSMLQLLIQLR